MIDLSTLKELIIDGIKLVELYINNILVWKSGFKNWVRYSTESGGAAIYNGGLGYKNGYRVRSGVDVLMPGAQSLMSRRRTPDGTLLKTYGKKDGITLGEMQYCAKHVLKCVMKLKQL